MENLRADSDGDSSHRRCGTGREVSLPRKLFAEWIGTFALTFVGAGIEMIAVLHPLAIDRTSKAAASSLIVAAMIYAVGDIGGAHLNPAVTLMFTVRRSFPLRNLLPYWLAQLAGACAAAAVLREILGTVGHLGASQLHDLTPARGYLIELFLTALLAFVILNAAHKHSLIGTQAAIAVGATIAACNLLGGELTTASMNPARSIGPALVGGYHANLWIFVAGPISGAILALAITVGLRPHRNEDEFEAADGH